jgi:hypothetical protein
VNKLKENYERMFGSIKEDWWDDMDASAQAAYINKHPGSKQAQQADDEADDKMKSNDRAADDEADDMDRDARFAADGEEPSGEEKPSAWSQKAQRAKDDLEQLSDPDEIGDWIEDNKWSLSGGKLGRAADLEFAPVQKAYAELEDAYMEGDWDVYDKAKEDFTKLTNQKLDSQKVSRSRRTGNELNQETLTIDGKQFRRISEKTSKPKYKFSELYKRFKK